MPWKVALYWLAFVLVCFGRFFVPGPGLSWPGTYEALAHLWVGAALAAWWYDRQPRHLWAAGAATALETAMFLTRGQP